MNKQRLKISKALSNQLHDHFPSNKTHTKFMCPTCLKLYKYNDEKNITDGHILPKASGGKLLTLLCKDCNSKFGSKQDKWLGEYINILLDKDAGMLSAKTKRKYVEINGNKVRADIIVPSKGPIDVNIYNFKNADNIVLESEMNITVDIPLFSKEREVIIGFLTAGYLLWFKEFGYSWALQSHLYLLREQLFKPSENIIDSKFYIQTKTEWEPSIGIITIDGHYLPAALIYDCLIVFPAVKTINNYAQLANKLNNYKNIEYNPIKLFSDHQHPSVMGLIYKDTLLMFPDTARNGQAKEEKILNIEEIGKTPRWMESSTRLDKVEANNVRKIR